MGNVFTSLKYEVLQVENLLKGQIDEKNGR